MVRLGWYYRNKPIVDEDFGLVGVVIDAPFWRFNRYEKLSFQKNRWCIIEREENTLVACVYTLDGSFEYYPLYNLIKVEE